MVVRLSEPEIISVNSEQLEATVRDLLPSQAGFGSELQASNVITPIIDLTATAEGSVLRSDLQNAWDFATDHNEVDGTTTAIVTGTGFFRVQAYYTALSGGSAVNARIEMTDGATTKILWEVNDTTSSTVMTFAANWNEIVFMSAGMTLNAIEAGNGVLNVSTRQVATVTGNLVNPLNFVAE